MIYSPCFVLARGATKPAGVWGRLLGLALSQAYTDCSSPSTLLMIAGRSGKYSLSGRRMFCCFPHFHVCFSELVSKRVVKTNDVMLASTKRILGPICGRQAIEKKYVNFFEQSHPTGLKCSVDQVCAVGHVSWNSGDWSFTLRGENGPYSIKGYRLDILVREGNAWKEYISCYNMAQAAATPETK
jgi:ketosteroid isomerase-like protein